MSSSNSRDLTQGAVWRKLLQLAGPMVFGIVAVLSISLADTYFTGLLGEAEQAALSFTFPVTLTITSLAIGLSAGAASLVSRAVGGDEMGNARRYSTDALFLATVLVIIITVIGYFSIRPIFGLLGAEGEVLDLIERYMQVWFYSMPFLVVPMVANGIVRAVGDAFWPSLIMIGSAIVNIATTPIFTFGWGPIPAMDIEGVGWGTFLARVLTLIFGLFIVIRRENLVDFAIPELGTLVKGWGEVLRIGLPAAFGNAVNPIGIAVVTAIIATFGASTVAAFGVATRIESFASIPMLALSSAIGPMSGQNWGAGNKDRVRKTLLLCYKICVGWALILAILFYFAGEPIAGLLAANNAIAQDAALYLKIVPISLFGYGIAIVTAGMFNALGRSVTGLGVYLARTMMLYVPLAWIGSLIAGEAAIYVGIAIANGLAGLIVAIFALRWLKKTEISDCTVTESATETSNESASC